MIRRIPLLVGALAACLALFAALQAPGLAFQRDDQLRMVQPADLEEISGEVLLRWKVSAEVERLVTERRAYFAVFVDRAPIRPGQSLAVLADDSCRREPSCPNREWLAERHIYVSQTSAMRLSLLSTKSWTRDGTGHEATVVLMRADGRRWGEHAAGARFFVQEERS